MKQIQHFNDLLTITSLVAMAATLFACVTKNNDSHLSDTEIFPSTTDTTKSIATTTGPVNTPVPSQTPKEELTFSGWFTILWNDEAHYFITDDEGYTIEVLLDEQLTKPYGGPLALDRSRVTIVGVILSGTTTTLQAQSIAREGEQ